MRKISLICLSLLLPVVFSSCGNFKQKFGRLNSNNTLTITVSNDPVIGQMAWSSVAQQFMVYIVGAAGTDFQAGIPIILGSNSSAASVTIPVPNGTYHGYALAWNSNDLSGDVGCWQDYADHTISGGGSENVNITVSGTASSCNYNSASGPFGPASFATTANFFPLTIRACQGSTPTNGSTCTPATTSTAYASGSVRVVMDGYAKIGGNYYPPPANAPQGLTGACVTLSGSGASTSAPWIIPVGISSGFDKFLSTTIYFYPSGNTTCSGSAGRIIGFPNGLINGSADGGSGVTNVNSISINVGS